MTIPIHFRMFRRSEFPFLILAGILFIGSPASCLAQLVSKCLLFRQLVETGVEIEATQRVRLEPPLLNQSQTTSERKSALDRLAGDENWERFARNSPVAPIALDIRSIESSSGGRIGYAVKSAFVLHTSMERLRDQTLMERLFGKPDLNDQEGMLRFEEITQAKLQEFRVEVESGKITYSRVAIPLLNKIRLQGVIRVERVESERELDVSWLFDNTLGEKNPEWQSVWLPLSTNDLAETIVGPPQPYSGSGGYIRLSEIDQPEKMVVVEMGWVIHEPHAWFEGGNLLRSKLPLLIQESVRSFRKKLQTP